MGLKFIRQRSRVAARLPRSPIDPGGRDFPLSPLASTRFCKTRVPKFRGIAEGAYFATDERIKRAECSVQIRRILLSFSSTANFNVGAAITRGSRVSHGVTGDFLRWIIPLTDRHDPGEYLANEILAKLLGKTIKWCYIVISASNNTLLTPHCHPAICDILNFVLNSVCLLIKSTPFISIYLFIMAFL